MEIDRELVKSKHQIIIRILQVHFFSSRALLFFLEVAKKKKFNNLIFCLGMIRLFTYVYVRGVT